MTQVPKIRFMSVRKIEEVDGKELNPAIYNQSIRNNLKRESEKYEEKIKQKLQQTCINKPTISNDPTKNDYYTITNVFSGRIHNLMGDKQSPPIKKKKPQIQNQFKQPQSNKQFSKLGPKEVINGRQTVEIELSNLISCLVLIKKGQFPQSLEKIKQDCSKHPQVMKMLEQTVSEIKKEESIYSKLADNVIKIDFLGPSQIMQPDFEFFSQIPQIFYQFALRIVQELGKNRNQIEKSQIKRNFDFICQKIRQSNAKFKQLQSQLSLQQQQKENANKQLRKLQNQIDSMRKDFERQLQKKCTQRQVQISSLQSGLQKLQHANTQESHRLQQQIKKHQIKVFEQTQLYNKTIDELNKRVKTLEDQNKALSFQKQSLKQQIAGLTEQFRELQQSLEQALEENQCLRQKVVEDTFIQEEQVFQKSAKFQKKKSPSISSTKAKKLPKKYKNSTIVQKKQCLKSNKPTTKKQNPIIQKTEKIDKTMNKGGEESDGLIKENQELCSKIQKMKEEIQKLNKEKTQRFYTGLFESSNLIDFHQNEKKSRIYQILFKYSELRPIQFKLIYKFDSRIKDNFHNYIDDKPNILVLIRLSNKILVGGFAPKGLNQGNKSKSGMIFTINQNQSSFYTPRAQSKLSCMPYNDHYLQFGNGQIRISMSSTTLYTNFGTSNSHFDFQNDLPSYFLYGQNDQKLKVQRNAEMIGYECYQVVFSK